VVRLALQQLLDTGMLPVREAELAVEWLFRDGAQKSILDAWSEGGVRVGEGMRLPPTKHLPWLTRRARTDHDAKGSVVSNRRFLPHARRSARVYPRTVTRRYWPLILILAAAWGASYLFIKVGVDGGLSPGALMAARALLAGVVLLGYLIVTLGLATAVGRLRAAWRESLVLGLLNAALPFWLIAWGEEHIDSNLAAIAQSTVPIFSLLIGLRFLRHERIGPARIFGVCLGIVGVAFVAGIAPAGDTWAVAGTLAVVLSSAFYASAGIYSQLRLKGTISGPVLATGSMLAGGVMLLPLAIARPPTSMPTAGALGSLLLLSLVGTVLAQLVFFRVIALFGARRVSLVTYLIPGFALVYGALILDERLTVSALIGLALILLGVALGSGAMRLRRHAPVS
jgi:drug/metabolite transporter (DMT)-like permease